MLNSDDIVLVSSLTALAIALFAQRKLRENVLAPPLVVFCVVQFAWMFCHWAHRVAPADAPLPAELWGKLDFVISPFTSAAGLHFVSAFVGSRRTLRRLVLASYLIMSVLSLTAVAWFASPAVRRAWPAGVWGTVHIVLLLPMSLAMFWLLVDHWRRYSDSPRERLRTMILFFALLLGTALAVYDMFPSLGGSPAIPATLITMVLMAYVAFDSMRRDLPILIGVYAVTLLLGALLAYGALLERLSSDDTVTFVAVGLVTCLLVAAITHAVSLSRSFSAQTEHLAFLGRASGQLAHDLRNPIASIRGAAQFLLQERAEGRAIDDQTEFLDLIVAESERLTALLEEYQRHGALEPERQRISLNALVTRSAHAASVGEGSAVDLDVHVADELGDVDADPVLLETALENVIRNGIEAMPDGGRLTVRTGVQDLRADRLALIEVEDEGEGIDPRLLDDIFREFFTTKATGSGLGLSYARRVLEAHGGSISVKSRVGRGTTIRMLLPVEA